MAFAVFFSQTLSLLLELAIFRFLSIEHFHQFASVAVGVALAGYGFSGFLVYLLGKRTGRFYRPEPYALAFPPAVTIAIVSLYFLKVEPPHLLVSPEKGVLLFILFLLLSAPFAISGAIVGSAFVSLTISKHRTYALSMVGAGSGVLLWCVLSPAVPLNAILTLIILFSTLLFFLAGIEGKVPALKKTALVILCLGGTGSLYLNPQPLSEYKALSQYRRAEGEREMERLYDLDGEYGAGVSDSFHILPGLSPRYRGEIPKQIVAFLNGSVCGWTFLPSPGKHRELLRHMPEMAPFLHRGKRALIAGYESGVLQAMAQDAGYEEVTVVDGRRGLLSLMARTGNFDYERAEVVPAMPHLYLRERAEQFDLLFIPEAGSLSYSMVYGKPLAEDYFLTEESLRVAVKRLRDGGIIATSGWSKSPLREEAKILRLFRSAAGKEDPEEFFKSVVVIYGYSRFVIMVAKNSFSPSFVKGVNSFVGRTGFSGIVGGEAVRGEFRDRKYEESLLAILVGGGGAGRKNPFFLEVPTYDMPYFYRFFRPERVQEIYGALGRTSLLFFESGYLMLLLSLAFVALTGFVMILVPSLFVLHSYSREKAPSYRILTLGVLCGMGYTVVEMICVGRAPFFFNSYTEGFLVVIGTFLTSSGVGAYLGERILKGRRAVFLLVSPAMLTIFSVVALLPLHSGPSIPAGPLFERIAFVGVCFFVAFFLGLYLPPLLSEMQARAGNEGLVALWGINNFSSLIGSLVTPVVTVSCGFSFAFCGVSVFYMVFSLLFLWKRG